MILCSWAYRALVTKISAIKRRGSRPHAGGCFGRVVRATYSKDTVVMKILHEEEEDMIRNMAKEVMLHQGLRHDNITEFMYVCVHPPSLMMGYECFHLGPECPQSDTVSESF
jgi:hypothetical protein